MYIFTFRHLKVGKLIPTANILKLKVLQDQKLIQPKAILLFFNFAGNGASIYSISAAKRSEISYLEVTLTCKKEFF